VNQKVIFRTDGSTAIGMGHVVRCLALADMLKESFQIVFALQHTDDTILKAISEVAESIVLLPISSDYIIDAENFIEHIQAGDIVVLDGYFFSTEYQIQVLSKKCKLVCLDDLHSWHHAADIIINHSEGISYSDYSTEPYTEIYTGLNYALLRKEFFEKPGELHTIKAVRKIFISMGAADVNNLSQRFVESLLHVDGISEIHLMIGAVNPHLAKIESLKSKQSLIDITLHTNISSAQLHNLLLDCDVAICPASTIALECCAVGIGLITGTTAENQRGILLGLLKSTAAIDLGDFLKPDQKEMTEKFKQYFSNPEYFNQLVSNQRKMIDGKSPERIVSLFNQLTRKQLRFRFALESDVDLYFKWTNDPLVRKNSYNQNSVNYADHVNWFSKKLSSSNCFFYLFFNLENIPVGQVRIENVSEKTIIGISIDENFRGKSYGVEMLKLATSDYLRRNPGSTILAYIKEENFASKSIFSKAGFMGEEFVIEQGFKSHKLYKN
jgi:UDP-2,4-diacetamido-2,4,6-trideoxy-beta-L-altropyranose hydrolase